MLRSDTDVTCARSPAASLLVLAVAVVSLAGCLSIGRFECDHSDGDGPRPCDEGGQCIDGSCAYPTESCPSGWRFSPTAESADACTPCGGAGQPCCVTGDLCEAGQYCTQGTCDCFFFSEVEAGAEHTCTRDAAGAVRCWGSNDAGESGSPDTSTVGSPPVVVPAPAIEVSAGEAFTCARSAGGDAFCWGSNADGRLGIGDDGGSDGDTHVPVRVEGLVGVNDIDAGGRHACAIVDGQVYCWGANIDSQIAQPDSTQSFSAPVPVTLMAGAVELALGAAHSCVLDEVGDVWCWGRNAAFELGASPLDIGSESAVPYPSLSGMRAMWLVAGSHHTCAATMDGTIWCWGLGDQGQLGDGDPTATDEGKPPVQVIGLRGLPVAAGSSHTCGLDDTRALFCWGNGEQGQLGDGARTSRSTPVSVIGVGSSPLGRSSIDVAANSDFTCAITGGNLDCWGEDSSGQLLAEGEVIPMPARVPLSCP